MSRTVLENPTSPRPGPRDEAPPPGSDAAQHPLLVALENDRVEPGTFGHREHVHAAWLLVRAYPFDEAVERCRTGLRALAKRAGAPEKYHETITVAYLVLTLERATRPEAPTDWDGFADAHPELFSWNPGLLDRYYRPETIRSDEARLTFVPPDGYGAPKMTLPSGLQRSSRPLGSAAAIVSHASAGASARASEKPASQPSERVS